MLRNKILCFIYCALSCSEENQLCSNSKFSLLRVFQLYCIFSLEIEKIWDPLILVFDHR